MGTELRLGSNEGAADETGDPAGPLSVEVRPIIWVCRVFQCRRSRLPKASVEFTAQQVQVDELYLMRRGHFNHRVCIWDEAVCGRTALHGGDQDGIGSGGAGLRDKSGKKRLVVAFGIGVLGMVWRMGVIVTKLNQYNIRLPAQQLVPQTRAEKGLRTPAPLRQIFDDHAVVEISLNELSPAL